MHGKFKFCFLEFTPQIFLIPGSLTPQMKNLWLWRADYMCHMLFTVIHWWTFGLSPPPGLWAQGWSGYLHTNTCFQFCFFFSFLEAIPRSAIVGSFGYYDPWPITMNPPAAWETWVWSLGREKPLEEYMTIHSSILAWRIPMDRGAWWAIVHGVTQSQTWLSN